ncbi:hypothetical protein [Bradyrhizobium sp. B117]|uniref:hypothetical protein n=1 Tax=Bradyrhizobium sp. B117 TaxID=3140246 RepID=UPI0031834E67
MKAVIAAACVGTLASGCVGTDLSKLVPGSVSQLQAAFQTTAEREATLITQLQLENDTLDFMSAGSYSCGDPNDMQQRRLLSAKDPAQFVKEEKVSEAWQKSLIFLAAYLKTLNSIADANKQAQEDIASLTSIAKDVANNVPGFPTGTAAAASAFQAVISSAVLNFNAVKMQQAAQRMEAPLEAAVANVKKFYPVFVGNEHAAFVKWDSCAQEKLRFIRDNPLSKVRGYPPLFAIDSGTRLDEAYAAYAAKRNQLRGTPPIADLAKAVLAENRKLADPLKNLTLSDLATAGNNAATILDNLKAAVKAGEALAGNKTGS